MNAIQSLGQVARSAIKKVFATLRAPEGILVEALARLRTQLHVPFEIIFLKHPSLHGGPHFPRMIVD
jgi:hypothetical protein